MNEACARADFGEFEARFYECLCTCTGRAHIQVALATFFKFLKFISFVFFVELHYLSHSTLTSHPVRLATKKC